MCLEKLLVEKDNNFFSSEIHRRFKTYLVQLMPAILAPSKLIPKKINGQERTASELLKYFEVF
jgi:hypothetical protein